MTAIEGIVTFLDEENNLMMEVMLHSLLTKIHDMKLNGGSHVGLWPGHHQPAQGQDDPRHHEADQHPAQGGDHYKGVLPGV